MPLIFPRLNEELLCELLRIHIIHISIFAEYQFNILESLLGGGGGRGSAHSLHPPPRSASASYLLDFEIILAKLYYFLFFFHIFKKIADFPSTKALLGVN